MNGDGDDKTMKGRRKNEHGYYEILCKDHPFCNNKGYVREHRLIMEKHLRETNPGHPGLVEVAGVKYLRRDWEPHHENFNKLDNDIDKLKVMPHDEHAQLHIMLREQAKKDTVDERRQIERRIFKETVIKESER